MRCPSCNAEVEEGADLCLECGEPMGDSVAARVARADARPGALPNAGTATTAVAPNTTTPNVAPRGTAPTDVAPNTTAPNAAAPNAPRPPAKASAIPSALTTTVRGKRSARPRDDDDRDPVRCPGCGTPSKAARCPGCGIPLRADD